MNDGLAAPGAPAGGGGWRDDAVARDWADGDRLEPLLALPRRITAELFAAGEPPVRRVLDVGAGPGSYLAAVLERCPGAEGTWSDVSDAMEALATERLSHLGGRVRFVRADATALHDVGEPASFEAVVTSRMSHHLSPGALGDFYADAARLVRAGGWLANLDHVSAPEAWAGALQRARAAVVPPNPSPHGHARPHPTLDDHRRALADAGWSDAFVAWKAFSTVLVLARRP